MCSFPFTKKTYELRLKKIKSDIKAVKITESKNAADFARNFYADDLTIYESFFIILLDRENKAHSWVKISQGGTIGTVIDIKIIAKYAVDTLSNGIVLVHNHPSGNLKPSAADKTITNKAKEALKLFDCQVLDHIILTENNYYSFGDDGIL